MKERVNFHIFVTPTCNLKCKHCYSSENIVQGKILSIEELKYIIRTLVEKYDCYFDIEGGELFTRKDICELFEQLTPNELQRITITTNGTIYPSMDLNPLRELDEFRVSIEGHTDELHSSLRGIPLKDILNNCALWKNNGVEVTLRTTITKDNKNYIKEYFEKFVGLGYKRFSFYEYQITGRGSLFEEKYALNENELEKVVEDIVNECSKYSDIEYVKISFSASRNMLLKDMESRLQKRGVEISSIANIPALTINYNGEMGYCPWKLNDFVIGKFDRDSFSKDIEKIVEVEKRNHDCAHCTDKRIIYRNK